MLSYFFQINSSYAAEKIDVLIYATDVSVTFGPEWDYEISGA